MAIINARISDELDKSLSMLAEALERSKSYIINKALQQYIMEQLEDMEDAEAALESMKDTNQKFYTSEEVDKILRNRSNV